jgi:hypothetical protein
MCSIIFIICALSVLSWGVTRVVAYVKYGINVGGHLKRAADSNTPQMAVEELDKAIKAIEERKWTEGYTSVLYRGPSDDMGFWYRNLVASRDELNTLTEESTPLERSNMLMKLRETLLDDTSEGTEVTAPGGISVAPHNKAVAFWPVISIIIGAVALFFIPSSKRGRCC